jgi:hypothetical protein
MKLNFTFFAKFCELFLSCFFLSSTLNSDINGPEIAFGAMFPSLSDNFAENVGFNQFLFLRVYPIRAHAELQRAFICGAGKPSLNLLIFNILASP